MPWLYGWTQEDVVVYVYEHEVYLLDPFKKSFLSCRYLRSYMGRKKINYAISQTQPIHLQWQCAAVSLEAGKCIIRPAFLPPPHMEEETWPWQKRQMCCLWMQLSLKFTLFLWEKWAGKIVKRQKSRKLTQD